MFTFVRMGATWFWSWNFVNCWKWSWALRLSYTLERLVVWCLRCFSVMLYNWFDHHQPVSHRKAGAWWVGIVWLKIRRMILRLIWFHNWLMRHWSYSCTNLCFLLMTDMRFRSKWIVCRLYFCTRLWSWRSIEHRSCSFSHLKSTW